MDTHQNLNSLQFSKRSFCRQYDRQKHQTTCSGLPTCVQAHHTCITLSTTHIHIKKGVRKSEGHDAVGPQLSIVWRQGLFTVHPCVHQLVIKLLEISSFHISLHYRSIGIIDKCYQFHFVWILGSQTQIFMVAAAIILCTKPSFHPSASRFHWVFSMLLFSIILYAFNSIYPHNEIEIQHKSHALS